MFNIAPCYIPKWAFIIICSFGIKYWKRSTKAARQQCTIMSKSTAFKVLHNPQVSAPKFVLSGKVKEPISEYYV